MFQSKRALMLVAGGGSAALLLGALAFQYIGGLPPCAMCIWQRYGHGTAIAAGLLAVAIPSMLVALLGLAGAASTAAIGVYHAGVERGWWEGPNTCTSGPIDDVSPSELLDQILAAPVVRCDEVLWSMLGLSMAGWNALLSAGLAGLWILALVHARRSA